MTCFTKLIFLFILTFVLNLPFGYWRGAVKKFSWQWFIAIHLPVVLLYSMRIWLNVERTWLTIVAMVFLFFTGQWIGKKLRKKALSANTE